MFMCKCRSFNCFMYDFTFLDFKYVPTYLSLNCLIRSFRFEAECEDSTLTRVLGYVAIFVFNPKIGMYPFVFTIILHTSI